MKKTVFIISIFIMTCCGFRGPPTPIFPASKSQIDYEMEKRDKEKSRINQILKTNNRAF